MDWKVLLILVKNNKRIDLIILKNNLDNSNKIFQKIEEEIYKEDS